jgi:hypothetical protein
MVGSLLVVLQLASFEAVQPPVLHQFSWQSCRQDDGSYAELALQHTAIKGAATIIEWELHLGPRNEFALYDRVVNHPDDVAEPHDSPDNLLMPQFRIEDQPSIWRVPSLHLRITGTRAGGSRDECDSFYLRIEKEG